MWFLAVPIIAVAGAFGGTALATGYAAKQAEPVVKWGTVGLIAVSAAVIVWKLKR